MHLSPAPCSIHWPHQRKGVVQLHSQGFGTLEVAGR